MQIHKAEVWLQTTWLVCCKPSAMPFSPWKMLVLEITPAIFQPWASAPNSPHPTCSRAEPTMSKAGATSLTMHSPPAPSGKRWEQETAQYVAADERNQKRKKITAAPPFKQYKIWGKAFLPLYSFSITFTFFSDSK